MEANQKNIMNNVITASRMNSAMSCLRKHFWSYEVGLRREEAGLALRIGSAWARAMEARWNKADYETALACAIPEGIDLDAYSCATVAALLAGYYDYWGQRETFGSLCPEAQFDQDLEGGWKSQGKLDGLGQLKDGRPAIIEAKTTSDSLAPDSDYWMRLYFNLQVLQYATAARSEGWDVSCVFYDVTKKPAIRPKEVDDLDTKGRKIVLDIYGKRIYAQKKVQVKPKGKVKKGTPKKFALVDDPDKPRQSASNKDGWFLKTHIETPDEFCDRLWKDTRERPEFYFCRKEVPILDDQLEAFRKQRDAIVKMIISLRMNEDSLGGRADGRDPDAWPRNVSTHTCNFCDYKSFCLQNITPSLTNPPKGFRVSETFNPELTPDETTDPSDPSASA